MLEFFLGLFGLALISAVFGISVLRKDVTSGANRNRELQSQVDNYKWAIEDSEGKYTHLADGLQKELLKLEEQVADFKHERDPDSNFPSMAGTIQEANAIANLRMLQRLKKDLA